MTKTTEVTKVRYEGNGVTDTFAFNGRIFASSDLVVEIITRATDALVETLTLTTDYTVTINSPESASVKITNALKIPSSLQDIQIRISLDYTQSLNLPTGTVFPAVSVENALDRNVVLMAQIRENVDRAVSLPITSSLSEIELPTPLPNTAIVWNSTADGLTTVSFASLSSAIDTDLSGISDGDLLVYNASTTLFEPLTPDYVELSDNNTWTGDNDFSGSTVTLPDATISLIKRISLNSQSDAYTAVIGDANGSILHPSADTTARTWTIPANASVAYPIGTTLTFVNQNGAGVITISITSDTMRLAGAGTTGNRTLAANGVATAYKITSTEWIISGSGLS